MRDWLGRSGGGEFCLESKDAGPWGPENAADLRSPLKLPDTTDRLIDWVSDKILPYYHRWIGRRIHDPWLLDDERRFIQEYRESRLVVIGNALCMILSSLIPTNFNHAAVLSTEHDSSANNDNGDELRFLLRHGSGAFKEGGSMSLLLPQLLQVFRSYFWEDPAFSHLIHVARKLISRPNRTACCKKSFVNFESQMAKCLIVLWSRLRFIIQSCLWCCHIWADRSGCESG